MTLPLIVIAALLLDRARSNPSSPRSSGAALAPVSVPAPPSSDDRTVSTCANVISALPLVVAGQDLRRTVSDPSSPSIVAWGDPPIVLRCGAARPAELKPNSSTVFVTGGVASGPYYDVTTHSGANIWTTVDRAVYIEVTVPVEYNSAPLTPISQAIAKVLPAVCIAGQAPVGTTDQTKLCTRRP